MAVKEVIHFPFWAQLSLGQTFLTLPSPEPGAETPLTEITDVPQSIGISTAFPTGTSMTRNATQKNRPETEALREQASKDDKENRAAHRETTRTANRRFRARRHADT